MDIKKNRRDAATGATVEGNYPGANGKTSLGQGSAASDNNIGWDIRAQSFQRGADTDYKAIERENNENHKRFGTPFEDNFPAPSDPAGPKNCGARYQTASYDGNDSLPNPHNFSNNPGFAARRMGTTGGGTGRPAPVRMMNAGGYNRMPAASSNDARSEGSPIVISSGFNG